VNIQLALGFILATLLVCACAAQDTPPNQNTPPNTTSADEHKARELKLVALLNQKLTEAKAARDAGDWNKAIAILEEASTIDPSRDLLWFKLAEAYRGAGRYAEAATAYKKAIAIKPIGAYYNI
jgi:Tfp pilus assembly protein PilF